MNLLEVTMNNLSVNGIETEYNRDAHATDAAVFGVDSNFR